MRTIDGFSSATSRRSASWLSRRPQNDDAGDHSAGFRLPSAIRVCASPEATICGSTKTGREPLSCCSELKRSISGFNSGSFSGE